MEAIAIRLEAIASRLEAIAIRLEAIASRLKAIAIRLEAIASSQLGPGPLAAAALALVESTWVDTDWVPLFLGAMDGDARLAPADAREILASYALWGDMGGWLPDRPSLLVDNLVLRRFDDLFLMEADHLTASGRGLKYLDADSVWVGPDEAMPQTISLDWKAEAKSAMHNMCIQDWLVSA